MLYRTILADPPWKYTNVSPPCLPEKQPQTCLIEYYYPTLTLPEIKALPVWDMGERDSVLFLWATTPMLPEAFDVMRSWGWKYKTLITWHKTDRDCMGYWFRTCTEHLLVGVRGKVRAFRSMQRNIIECQRGKHSEKPEMSYALIERVAPEPRLELFARRARLGWDVWGNEVDSDPEVAKVLA
jgi:N6-adenosine-specific RNA methylase IME4